MKRLYIIGLMVIGLLGILHDSAAKGQTSPYGAESTVALIDDHIRDPNTGLEFKKVCGISGSKDVIDYNYNSQHLRMSPNGKFLLYNNYVIPVGDGEIIQLVDFPALRSSWSPDGSMIAIYSNGIWVIPVSQETGRPTGPAKELIDGNYMYQQGITSWSPDSKKFSFLSTERYLSDISIEDGKITKYTKEGEGHGPTGWSPDGRWRFYKKGNEKGIWLISTEGGEPRKLADKEGSSVNYWSPDGKWVFYQRGQELHFVRISDAHAFTIQLPEAVGNYVSWSQDGKRMLLYRCSYVWTDSLRIVPSSGGESFGPRTIVLSSMVQHWSPDSRFVLTWGKYNDKDVYWIIPLTGDDPFPLQLNVAMQGKLGPTALSPGASRLLIAQHTPDERVRYWVTPTSLRQGKTLGQPIKVFDKGKMDRVDWSPDGSKLAFFYEEDLWMARTDGTAPVQLTEASDRRVVRRAWSVDGSAWSPDGSTIAWISYYPDSGRSLLRMRQLYEKESRLIAESSKYVCFKWSPYGNYIAYELFDRREGTTKDLFVVAVPDGKPKRLIESSKGGGLSRNWAWSPNEDKLALLADHKLTVFTMPEGQPQQVGRILPSSWRTCFDMEWSPNGAEIAVITMMESGPSEVPNNRVFTVTVPEGKWTELAGKSGTNYYLYWSPDGKWISYDSEEFVKIRPEGILWEVEIGSYLEEMAAKSADPSTE